uniref:Transporter n=1 Tax=Chromera velia CCMP2878 TaxID=1169474 RepID=A0A0G4HF70_9ALVE|eukprot:Cvel_6576.t1-p1 / transcript=Cvel_6576.t1 / gene=Cvel_6576 / organism=Chromera_velia_CCMP2878 / gene_product=Sodium-dependent serotonin transporter, putative / transcript_product=Sodium-dependent serotonin transporter, putative / location=Cvel_scaffold324:58192-60067(-) / protein_length=488 / sequence_SO=supercontig / SO=protein_coding / is_pseudo=false
MSGTDDESPASLIEQLAASHSDFTDSLLNLTNASETTTFVSSVHQGARRATGPSLSTLRPDPPPSPVSFPSSPQSSEDRQRNDFTRAPITLSGHVSSPSAVSSSSDALGGHLMESLAGEAIADALEGAQRLEIDTRWRSAEEQEAEAFEPVASSEAGQQIQSPGEVAGGTAEQEVRSQGEAASSEAGQETESSGSTVRGGIVAKPADTLKLTPDASPVPTAPNPICADLAPDFLESVPQKKEWKNPTELILALVGYAVGLGNVWRFPDFIHQNGGLAALIPYLILTFVLGVPLLIQELGIGFIYNSQGVTEIWRGLSPWTSGAGLAASMLSFCVGVWYTVFIGICLLYLFNSMASKLPWDAACAECDKGQMSGAEFYLMKTVFNVSESGNEIGDLQGRLVIALGVCWAVVWGVLFRGMESFRKCVYPTAFVPPAILLAILVRAVTLEGSWEGIKFFCQPEWNRLLEVGGAGTFFSVSWVWGIHHVCCP